MSKAYRLKKGRISRPEKDGRKLYEPGDVVQMSAEQLAAFTGVLEPAHSAPAPEEKKPAAESEAPKKEKRTLAAELVETIANSDSVDEVTEILAAEVADANRRSVVEAANAKLEDLVKEE